MRVTSSQLPAQRAKMLEAQNGQCMLCLERVPPDEAVLDHCHATGHLRGTLHRGCNSMLGVIENNRPRYMLRGPRLFAFLSRVEAYVTATYSHNPLHPLFKTPEQKRVAKNAKARKARAAAKITSI